MAKAKADTVPTVTSSAAAAAAKALSDHFDVHYDPRDHDQVVRVVLEGAGIQVVHDGDQDAETDEEPTV